MRPKIHFLTEIAYGPGPQCLQRQVACGPWHTVEYHSAGRGGPESTPAPGPVGAGLAIAGRLSGGCRAAFGRLSDTHEQLDVS